MNDSKIKFREIVIAMISQNRPFHILYTDFYVCALKISF